MNILIFIIFLSAFHWEGRERRREEGRKRQMQGGGRKERKDAGKE
jgi:hypothetical protein